MAKLINLKSYHDHRGSLTVIEKELPFSIKRVYFIYDVEDFVRGGHRHKMTEQAAICIKGSCVIYCANDGKEEEFLLDNPEKCLILYPEDWHKMYHFSPDAVLLVLASTPYDPEDYITDMNDA